MRCERCSKAFRDGDVAYEIGIKRVRVVGKVIRMFQVEIYVCEQCVLVEEGEYR